MAKVLGVTPNQISGKVGGLIYEQFDDDTFVYAAPTTHKDTRTGSNLGVRVKLAVNASNYSAFEGRLVETFEHTKKRQNALGLYVQANYPETSVWLTKRQIEEGYQILEPVYVSRGTADAPVQVILESDRMVSNISTGDLVVTENTKFNDLVAAITANNASSIHLGDSLYFIRVTQKMATEALPPRIKPQSKQLVLRYDWAPSEEATVYDVLGEDGLMSMPYTFPDGRTRNVLYAMRDGVSAVAWTVSHPVQKSRKGSLSDFVCTTQKLVGDFPLVGPFSTAKCKTLAFNSYGGENKFNHVNSNNRYSTEHTEDSPDFGGSQVELRQYDLALAVSPADSGTATGAGRYQAGANVQLKAQPASGYRFLRWSDGSTDASRTIQMPASNYTYTAYFEKVSGGNTAGGTGNTDPTNPGGSTGGGSTPGKVQVTVTGNMTNNVEYLGSGEYTPGEQVQIQARVQPGSSLVFERWNDGNTQNPRTITVPDSPITYTAHLGVEMR